VTHLAQRLLDEVADHLAAGRVDVGVLGLTADGLQVAAGVNAMGGVASMFDPSAEPGSHPDLLPWARLAETAPNVVVVAADSDKETLLRAAAAALDGASPVPHVVLAGMAHQDRPDPVFEELEAPALVPSYATGHPHTRRHLYDYLRAAAAVGRSGAIVELGAFKGGTSVWLAKAVRRLGLHGTPVIAFDAWDGFPPRRSMLDLYEHPRCVFRDLDAVRAYTGPYGIELVSGDIFETAPLRLASEPVLVAFVDTDNYSGTRAALTTILPNLVPGGAIVLDHFWTTPDYVYTVGERLAASEVLQDSGLLHLHGTGVFVKLA
jgi:O-methyltransferase